jgi:hypothetical protein
MNLPPLLVEIIGWIGSVLVVLAYFLNIQKKLSSDSSAYKLMNLSGSLCLIVLTLSHGAIPSAAVNIIWAIIALAALLPLGKSA